MNIGQLIGRVAKFAKGHLKDVKNVFGAKYDSLVSTVNSKFTKVNAVKIAGAAATAKVFDEEVQNIPVAKNIYNWWATTLDDIYGSTIYKIPEVGDFLKKISDCVGKILVPNAQRAIEQHRNNPNWYTDLEQHTEFKIPMVYPDTVPLVFGSKIATSAINVITLGFNPLSDVFAIESRLNHEMDLLKAVRGLSGRLPYSRAELFYYHLITYYVINEYYKLKFTLRASNAFVMSKSRMPRNIMTEMGWNYDDFLANKALYKEALTTLANFIKISMPAFGTLITKIKSMWDCFVPDSNDGKVALFYKVYPLIDGYLPSISNNVVTYERFGDKFYDFTPDKYANDNIPQCGRAYGMTYAVYIANMNSFLRKFLANDIFVNIKADIIGAFGPAAFSPDKDFKQVENGNVFGKFDELYLTELQNATLIEERPFMVDINGGRAAIQASEIYYTASFGGIQSDGTLQMPVQWTGAENNVYAGVKYTFHNITSSAAKVFFPSTDGRSSGYVDGSTTTMINTDNLTVIANKYSLSEGENLEIIQLLACEVGGNGYVEHDDTSQTDVVARHFLTQNFFAMSSDYLYYDGTQDRTVRTANTILPPAGSLQAAILPQVCNAAQLWSQSDYMMKFHIARANSDDTTDDNLLLDYNIMGSLSGAAFRQAIRYSTYSIYAAKLKAEDTRKVNNVADVYNTR